MPETLHTCSPVASIWSAPMTTTCRVDGAAEYLGVGLLPRLRGQQLGVGRAGHPPDAGRIEHDGRHHERARAGSPSGLVDAGYRGVRPGRARFRRRRARRHTGALSRVLSIMFRTAWEPEEAPAVQVRRRGRVACGRSTRIAGHDKARVRPVPWVAQTRRPGSPISRRSPDQVAQVTRAGAARSPDPGRAIGQGLRRRADRRRARRCSQVTGTAAAKPRASGRAGWRAPAGPTAGRSPGPRRSRAGVVPEAEAFSASAARSFRRSAGSATATASRR